MINGLLAMAEKIKALPEPIAYIVLDHAMPGIDRVEERDGHGRKYVRVTPAVMDHICHLKAFDAPLASLIGVPIYRRQDMPEGWPYNEGRT